MEHLRISKSILCVAAVTFPPSIGHVWTLAIDVDTYSKVA